MARSLAFDSPRYINPLALPAPELIDLFERKRPRAIGNWRELGAEEYGRSFTAARTAGYDVVRDLYDGFLETLRDPDATEVDYAERVIPILRQKGWLPGSSDAQLASRVRLIYDTNLRVGQAVGRWARIQKNKAAMPYLLGTTARDNRVRRPPKSKEDHTEFEGIFLPVDHWFWTKYFPPLGFRCRCQVVQRTRSQALRAGLIITSEEELARRVVGLGEPWGFNPGAPPTKSLEVAVEATNRDRLEGLPPINPETEFARGSTFWADMLAERAGELVESLIVRLFGPGA